MNIHKKFPFRKDLFNYPCSHFKRHLGINENNRILFSGKFGIGKSFFLDHFFKDQSQIDSFGDIKYKSFHIYPINYSIASTEDVFRYIKYDVVSAMLLNKIELEEKDLSYLETLPNFLKGSVLKVLKTFIGMIPKIGKDVNDSHDKLEELRKDFLKFHSKLTTGQGDALVDFLQEEENTDASLFENDIITRLIYNILVRLKEKTGHENILIIDDLDRIDPEHIFRLLNVFAAHLDNPKGLANKLGFDKIIIVCDINNLRNIFKAKYGSQTDFNGYIDKFYSHDVYHFDNKEILLNISNEAFKNIEIINIDDRAKNYYESLLFKRSSHTVELLEILILNGFISLRTLITRLTNKIELDRNKYIVFDDSTKILQIDQQILIHFKILKEIVGEYDFLKEYLNRIPIKGFYLRDMNAFSNQLAFFVHYEKTIRTTGTATFVLNNQGYYLAISGREVHEKIQNLVVYPVTSGLSQNTVQHDYSIPEFLSLLNDFIDLLKRVGN